MRKQALPDARPSDYSELIRLIRAGDIKGEEELYLLFAHGFQYFLGRSIPAQDVEDKLHDTFIALVQEVRRGSLKNPKALPAFAYTILRRQIANSYRGRKVYVEHDTEILEIPDRNMNSLEVMLHGEKKRELERTLTTLAPGEREVIMRFYIADESPKQIQADMKLTEARFYRLKARGREKLLAGLRKPVQRSGQPRTFKREGLAV